MSDDSNSDTPSDDTHHCEDCGESEWEEQSGEYAGIVCGNCGYRPRKVVRDEIRESGAVLATDGGIDTETPRDEHASDLRQLQQAARNVYGIDRDDVVGCEDCMGAFIALSEPEQCPFCGSTEALR